MREKEQRAVKFIGILMIAIALAVYGGITIFRIVPWQTDYFHGMVVACLFLGVVMIGIVGYLLIYGRWEIWRIYPVVGFLMATMIFLALPTYSKPDEISHFDTAYELSNRFMNIDVGEGFFRFLIIRRECDTQYSYTELSVEQYNRFGALYLANQRGTDLVCLPNNQSSGEIVAYVVAALGITIGRGLHLGFAGIAALGTLFQTVFFLLAITYAMYKLPFGRRILFVVALLPMTLQQANSFSYDNALIASAVVVTSLSLHWCYGSSKRKEGLHLGCATLGEVVVFVVAALLLLFTKSGVYAPVLLLPLLMQIPKGWTRTGKGKAILVGIPVILFLVILILGITGTWEQIVAALSYHPYIAWADAYGFSPWDYLRNPGYVLRIFLSTLWDKTPYYVIGLLGGLLGWIDITISNKVMVVLSMVLLLSLVRTSEEKEQMRRKDRGYLIGTALLIDLLCIAAMLLYWTPMFSETVEGVQGRYFLPTLPALLMGIGFWKQPAWKRSVDGFVIAAMPIIDFAVILCIYINVITK